MDKKIVTSIVVDGARISIIEGRKLNTEDGAVQKYHAKYDASGAEYCELGVYEDGAVHASISAHSDETARLLCEALSAFLSLNK